MRTLTRRTMIGVVPAVATAIRYPAGPPRPAGTPASSGPTGLMAVLGLIPAAILDADDAFAGIVTISDLGAELEHTGVSVPESLSADSDEAGAFARTLIAVSTGGPIFEYAYAPDWRTLHGFDIRDIGQIVEFGQPPDHVTLLRGRFDRDEVDAALTRQGYETIDIDGVDVWNRGDDYAIDLEHPIGRYWVSQAQNFAMLGDDTLVIAGATGLIRAVIAAAAGNVDPVADDPRIAGLVSSEMDPLASAVIVPGILLAAGRHQLSTDGFASPDDPPFLPPVVSAILGATVGNAVGNPSDEGADVPLADYPFGENQVRLLLRVAGDVDTARDAIAARLEAGQSFVLGLDWIDLFERVEFETDDDAGIVVMSLPEWLPGRRSVMKFFFQEDVGFLAWD